MATIHLYRDDSYLREFTAKVVKVHENEVILDKSAFHPESGGVAHDKGYLEHNGRIYNVTFVRHDKQSDDIIHIVEDPSDLREGIEVKGVIDWERRYRLMRLHTAAHVISAIMYRDYNALITGGQIEPEYARDDFSLEKFDRRVFQEAIDKANEIVEKDIEVKIYYLSREEAMKIPGIVKLAERMPPNVKILRIVEIPGVDIQADGGPHVKRTGEIGKIKLLKVENRGRNKRRIYYTVD